MRKVLPFILHPPVIAYQYYAFPLGILFLNPDFNSYFFSHYINLYYKRLDVHGLNFVRERWFTEDENLLNCRIRFDKNNLFFDSQADLIEYVKEMIMRSCYVYSTFNAYYQPNHQAYHYAQQNHDMLLYGFDDGNQCFEAVGFNRRGIYEQYQISYTDYYMGTSTYPSAGWIHFIKVNPSFEFHFDYESMIKELKDFLVERDPYGQNEPDCVFGQAIYLAICEDYRTLRADMFIGLFRLLREHKTCMVLRLEYLLQNKYIYDESLLADYKKIESDYQKVFLLALKNQISYSDSATNRIIDHILDLCKHECDIVSRLITELEKYHVLNG